MSGCRCTRAAWAAAFAGVAAWAAGCGDEPTEPPNMEPVAVGSIPDMSLFPADTGVVVASRYFSDPDGDALAYTAAASGAGFVTISVSGDTVRLVAVRRGNVTVTVTATDPEGLSAEQGFAVTVANRAPEPVDSIPAMEVRIGSVAAIVVSGYFTDPDGDTLTYTARSSNRSVVTTDVAADTVRLAAGTWGNAIISVTATDPGGLVAVQGFTVEVPDPQRDILVELYDSTGGDGWYYKHNWLTDAPLSEWDGVSADQDGTVTRIHLGGNNLVGRIPSRLGELAGLYSLRLNHNELAGPVPPELGNLGNLGFLLLNDNELTGTIPTELGQLDSLWSLDLGENRLTGRIPSELGGLGRLIYLSLERNELEGPIPAEVGELALINVILYENRLTGPIPEELGPGLRTLMLAGNDFAGALPPGLDVRDLDWLHISDNPRLAGELPAELTAATNLRSLVASNTDLCAPSDSVFQAWLQTVEWRRVKMCGFEPSAAYLVQSVQSRDFPVPLVAGRDALLRVFVTASVSTNEGIPPVRAHFYLDGSRTHTADIPGKSTAIPTEVDEGSLDKSANARIPAQVIQPGLEMVVEVDPDGTLDDSLGVVKRIPEDGRLAIGVDSMPTFELTVIPFLWSQDPDSSVLEATEGMAEDEEEDELLFDTYDLLPMEEMDVSEHDPVESSTNDIFALLNQVEAIRRMEGDDRYYAGLMAGKISGALGVAFLGGRSSFSAVEDWVIAHELGHNLNLPHAPCGIRGLIDAVFPHPGGTIGSWGYDFRSGSLVDPGTFDHMSYCAPRWISDYFFTNAFEYRVSTRRNVEFNSAPQRSLLLWGRLDAEGKSWLEPAFVVDAPPALPGSPGPHSLIGRDGNGTALFSLDFEMHKVADGGDESASFVFILPVRSGWAGALASITLSGPGGSVTLDGDTDIPMAIVRDTESGQVRAMLRGDRVPPAAGPGLKVLLSRGIPARDAWER